MIRNILVFLVITFSNTCFAQTFVSTTAENKKAFLELYTGYLATFDPDGHLIADQIKSNYPNDFFISKRLSSMFLTSCFVLGGLEVDMATFKGRFWS